MLKIIQAPNPVLTQQAKPINIIDKSTHQLIKEMEQALIASTDPEGVGLAAPQVGKSVRLFLIKQSPRSPTTVFINPVIEEYIGNLPPFEEISPDLPAKQADKPARPAGGHGVQLEGCLSLYSIWGVVLRYPAVVLSYLDETGKKHKKKFTGFIATIIQHETDHLHGILFPKRVLEQKGKLYKSGKDEEGQTEFEEIALL